ncbi:hypothetical protein HGRIS_004823 [Hohenbuehelia grisea]|uniref:F-box protein n=1 Tax=Hohenbuehelia grisea TaxID=104357 RepID=A0ABR3JDJ6_9AGAR
MAGPGRSQMTQISMDGPSEVRRLPPEIWSMICASACLDTGVTGRSLSQVSRFIRQVSAPYKYQSVSILNVYELAAFADLIEDTPASFRRVKHLFVCDIPQARPRQDTKRDSRADDPLKVREVKANEAVTRIFRAVAQSLVSVHALFVFTHPFCLLPPLASRYPALTDLTLYHHYRSRPSEADLAKARDGGVLPALKRLSLVTAPQLHKTDFVWIGRLAPALAYLHVTAAHPWYDGSYSDFPLTMAKVLDGPDILPKSMTQVAIELPDLDDKPEDFRFSGISGTSDAMLDAYLERLGHLARTHQKVSLLPTQPGIETNLAAENRFLENLSNF